MHRILSPLALLLIGMAATPLLAQVGSQRVKGSRTATAAPLSAAQWADERAVRAVAAAYVKSYNVHDAKAVAALFTSDAQIVDARGDAIQGNAAIELVFNDLFREFPQATTSVTIKSIRFLSPSLAVEDGTAHVKLAEGEPIEPNDYAVVHVKQPDGHWLMASARDLEGPGAVPAEHLQQLAWLVGDWVDESPESLVKTTYRWDDSKNFLLSDFTVQVAGRPVMKEQRIGWDPLNEMIRSWTFDSEGGFAEGVYTRVGNRWVIKMSGVTRDGEPASSTNVITHLGRDRMSWQSHDRTIGGAARPPDVGEMIIVRPPPKPM